MNLGRVALKGADAQGVDAAWGIKRDLQRVQFAPSQLGRHRPRAIDWLRASPRRAPLAEGAGTPQIDTHRDEKPVPMKIRLDHRLVPRRDDEPVLTQPAIQGINAIGRKHGHAVRTNRSILQHLDPGRGRPCLAARPEGQRNQAWLLKALDRSAQFEKRPNRPAAYGGPAGHGDQPAKLGDRPLVFHL